MRFEKRLEDARARRQIVLEQKDRATRAAKAAAQRAPDPGSPPTQKSGDAQQIPRARPAGTNARALEAALRKRVPLPPLTLKTTVEPLPRTGEKDTSEVSEVSRDRAESSPPAAANADVAYSGPPKERKSRSGLRLFFIGSAVLVGFGVGIIAGPPIVARIQELVAPPLTLVAQDQAPRQPGTVQIAVADVTSLLGDVGRADALAIRRALPIGPKLTAFEPALPFVSPAPAEVSTPVADARPPPRLTQPAQPNSGSDAVDSAPSEALSSLAPQVISTPGTQVLALLNDPDELPSLPLVSVAPDVPSAAPKALSTVSGDTDALVDTAQPPAPETLSPRLTGIGNLETYLVHLQWPASLTRERLAEVQSVISDAGLPLGKLNRVGFQISSSQIRFFHRRDAVAAAALAERIGARSRDFTSFRPSPPIGTLEIFLSGSDNSQRDAAQNSAQPGAQDREFLELRNRLIESLRRGDHL